MNLYSGLTGGLQVIGESYFYWLVQQALMIEPISGKDLKAPDPSEKDEDFDCLDIV